MWLLSPLWEGNGNFIQFRWAETLFITGLWLGDGVASQNLRGFAMSVIEVK